MKKNQKILVLGAGIYQVPLIKTIKELGHLAYVCSIAGDYPGFEFADSIAEIDIANADKICQFALENDCKAILTTGSDAGIPSLGKVVDTLGLIGCGYEAAKNSSNKLLMKEVFLNNNISTPEFIKVHTLEECYRAVEKIGFPCILKVVDKSGSRGIIRIQNRNEVESAFNQVQHVSTIGYFIVEKYIEGTEFGVQLIIQFGKVLGVICHGDFVVNDLISVPVGHYLPYRNKYSLQEISTLVENAVRSLGIDNSIVNVDLIFDEEGLYILEIGARMGGTCIPEIINHYYGIDCYKMAIELSLGIPVEINLKESEQIVLSKILTSSIDGKVKKIEILGEVEPGLIQIQADIKRGDQVRKFKVGPDRIGQIIVKGSTFEESVELMEKYKNKVIFELE